MSLNPAMMQKPRKQQAQPEAQEVSVQEVNPSDLLTQGRLSPLVLGGQANPGKIKVDPEYLRQLISGMQGTGLFGQ